MKTKSQIPKDSQEDLKRLNLQWQLSKLSEKETNKKEGKKPCQNIHRNDRKTLMISGFLELLKIQNPN